MHAGMCSLIAAHGCKPVDLAQQQAHSLQLQGRHPRFQRAAGWAQYDPGRSPSKDAQGAEDSAEGIGTQAQTSLDWQTLCILSHQLCVPDCVLALPAGHAGLCYLASRLRVTSSLYTGL